MLSEPTFSELTAGARLLLWGSDEDRRLLCLTSTPAPPRSSAIRTKLRGHRFGKVGIALYRDAKRGRTIVKFDHAGPAVTHQSYDEYAIVEWATDNE
jgi:hypothetical protein